MAQATEHLLIFARLPEPGKTKTRLIGAFGAERATELYRALAQRSLTTAQRFAAERGCALTVCFSGGDAPAMSAEFGGDFFYREQVGEGLGDRLIHATHQAFAAGASRVVVLGTDCHELNEAALSQAFATLHGSVDAAGHDVVLGPARDGGYYLIGLKQPLPQLFEGIDWGTERVLEQTRRIAGHIGKRCALLGPLSDVDLPEDVLTMRGQRAEFPKSLFEVQAGKLSIVIPALNEAAQLEQTLQAIGTAGPQVEIILVDGGSDDRTLDIAQDHGCRTLVVNRGRGAQMNAGAAVSSGETLMFLHADTRLPSGYHSAIDGCLAKGHVAGAFRLGITGRQFGLRLLEWGANMRSRWLQLPYGDQALFLRSGTFFDMGGFASFPIMEDFELVRRLRRRGSLGLVPQQVATSGRRWQTQGLLKTTITNQVCVVAYQLGASPQRIAEFYRRRR